MALPRPSARLVRLAFLAALAVTLVAALTPPQDHPLQLFPWEKGDHLLAFFVLAILAALAAPRAPLPAVGLTLVLLGAGIEALQALPFVDRDPSFTDIGIDGAAIVAELVPMAAVRRRLSAGQPDRPSGAD